jgi:hypothetical protein
MGNTRSNSNYSTFLDYLGKRIKSCVCIKFSTFQDCFKIVTSFGATIGGHLCEKNFKIFLEMTPLGVKTCGGSEFDIFEAKKRFPDSGKACVLKRKVAKIAFLRLFDSIHRSFLNQGSVCSL